MSPLDNMVKLEHLGSGKSADVYKVENQSTNEVFALKVFKNAGEFMNEKESLSCLKHPSLVQSVAIEEPCHILMEFCENQTMIDYIKLGVQFPENVVRFYFKQLLKGIEYMHEEGYVHRDIKLDNILLNSQFQLKLGDFGFAVKPERGEKLQKIYGTQGYFAPEQLLKQDHFGQSSDIFQMGVVLFSMMNGLQPYESQASQEDPYYRLIMEKKYNRYWFAMEQHLGKKLPNDFKDLINKMLAFKVDERITLEEIQYHPWLNKSDETQEEATDFMQSLRGQLQNTPTLVTINQN